MGIKTVKIVTCDHCELEIETGVDVFYPSTYALIFHLSCILQHMTKGELLKYIFNGDLHKITGCFDKNGEFIRTNKYKELLSID